MKEGIKTLKGMIESAEDLLKMPEEERLKISKGSKLNLIDNQLKSDIKELKEALKIMEESS